jgi:flagellar basal body rod protein FlgB
LTIFKKTRVLGQMNTFGMLEQRLLHSAFAVRTATENLANLHTPYYRNRVPLPLRVGRQFKDMSLWQTNSRHMRPRNLSPEGFATRFRTDGQESLTQNDVSYTEELQRANKANIWHKQVTQLFQANLGMLQTVLRR